jgi:hypothetical protein
MKQWFQKHPQPSAQPTTQRCLLKHASNKSELVLTQTGCSLASITTWPRQQAINTKLRMYHSFHFKTDQLEPDPVCEFEVWLSR